jgi:hypothetical protein
MKLMQLYDGGYKTLYDQYLIVTNFRAHYMCWTLDSSYMTIGFSTILSRWPFVKQKMKLMQLYNGGNKTLYDHYLIVKVKYDWMERWAVRWVCCAPIIVKDSLVV